MNWNFQNNQEIESPQNAAIKDFSRNIYESIVREAIQNSLDNKNPNKKNEPVKVNFSFGEILKEKIPGYEDLLSRYNNTKEFWNTQSNYKTIFDAIDKRIKDFKINVPYLQISDYNTTGMDLGEPNTTQELAHTSYMAFTRGNNSVKTNADSGGSEGQGKATFFAASAIRTIFVHSVSKIGSICEGITQLATHKVNETQFSGKGFFNKQNNFKPQYEDLNNPLLIPFRRDNNNDLGSSISILGLWNYDSVKGKMIKSLLNNFWMAISEKELIVEIDDLKIDASCLEELIQQKFPTVEESSHTVSNPTKYGNPRPYFETWTKKCDNHEKFEKNLDSIGNCIFEIGQNSKYPGKVAFFRKQRMLILRSRVNNFISRGYCGVFICNDINGNKILKKMEGKTHTEWDPKYCLNEEDRKIGKSAIIELNKFISESWKEYGTRHFPDIVELNGLNGLNIKDRIHKNPKTKRTTPQKKENVSKSRNPFKKIGIEKKKFTSKKSEGEWIYMLSLENYNPIPKKIRIKVNPSTDALRFNDKDIIFLKTIKTPQKSEIVHNDIVVELNIGTNDINFTTNFKERIAMDLNILNYED